VILSPISGGLICAITRFAHNGDRLIAGTLDWSRYMGDRQLG